MTDACRLVWGCAGSPEITLANVAKLVTDTPGQCAVCGFEAERTADINRALGANFSDRSHLAVHTSRVCPACLWCCSGKPPATLRMWSIIAAPGMTLPESNPKAWMQNTPHLALLNRSNPGPIAAVLASPPEGPWVVTVAYSGQKHVVPYAHVNHGAEAAWTVRAEDHNVTAHPDEWAAVHAAAMALRKLGVPADDVLAGQPRYIKSRAALVRWSRLDAHLTGWHNSPLLNLALWCITKETMK